MRAFAELYERLDRTTSTNAKVEAMVEYFSVAEPADAAWVLFFLTGRRLTRLMSVRQLAGWVGEATGLPGWLIEESYARVGDLAETVSLLLDDQSRERRASDLPLHRWLTERILTLGGMTREAQREAVSSWWSELSGRELFIFNKLLTGALRVGVSQTLVTRALAKVADLPPAAIAHRLMGAWDPTPDLVARLLRADGSDIDASRPYPFYLASPLETAVGVLGDPAEWQAEWKWDGIRAQLVKRGGVVYLWSRGEELVSDRFPEVVSRGLALGDGTVLDGEILAFRDGRPLPFAVLQQRIGRNKLTPSVLAHAPVVFMVYDVLELNGADIREQPLSDRRARLEAASPMFPASELIGASTWSELAIRREEARTLGVEGLMLKRKSSPYRAGRKRGDWWKWKIDPYSIDAVLTYAQPGSGKRSGLYTDYTFAVWQGEALTTVAKAYSGLTDAEIAELDRWIRAHTTEKFGPVRAVEPVQVFELHFEAIQPSGRHKAGLALRFPRIARWRTDKVAAEADTLDRLRAFLGEVR